MTRALRRVHRRVWIVLAMVVTTTVVAGFVAKAQAQALKASTAAQGR